MYPLKLLPMCTWVQSSVGCLFRGGQSLPVCLNSRTKPVVPMLGSKADVTGSYGTEETFDTKIFI